MVPRRRLIKVAGGDPVCGSPQDPPIREDDRPEQMSIMLMEGQANEEAAELASGNDVKLTSIVDRLLTSSVLRH